MVGMGMCANYQIQFGNSMAIKIINNSLTTFTTVNEYVLRRCLNPNCISLANIYKVDFKLLLILAGIILKDSNYKGYCLFTCCVAKGVDGVFSDTLHDPLTV